MCGLILDGRGRSFALVSIVSGVCGGMASTEAQLGKFLFLFIFGCDMTSLKMLVTGLEQLDCCDLLRDRWNWEITSRAR